MKVVVLGCGPAGLMATHAFALAGHDVLVYSKKRKSEMYGAQYLHAPIPGMTDVAPVRVDYVLQGTVEGYRRKVYGPDSRTEVSPESLEESHDGWDIRRTYDNLWDTYGEYVQEADFTNSGSVRRLIEDLEPDIAVSTIPAPALCSDDSHSFMAQRVWAIGDAPERGVFCPIKVAKNSIVCNGEETPAWYRAANVFNRNTAEWPLQSKPPFSNVSEVTKPLSTTCTCLPDVHRLGRYGEWKKGVLSHEAFAKAVSLAITDVQGVLFNA